MVDLIEFIDFIRFVEELGSRRYLRCLENP